jgi:hypothetical protein
MGRHSLSYIAAQQELWAETHTPSRTASYVGRVGRLAVALGIGVAVAGGTAIAGADTPSSNGSDDRPAQSSTAENDGTESHATASRDEDGQKEASDDDPASAPPSSLQDLKDPTDDTTQVELDEPSVVEEAPAAERRSARTTRSPEAPELTLETPSPSTTSTIATIAAVDPAVPAPSDQTTTDYGDIGKWMLQWNGDIADYGGLPYEGKTLLETVNVIFVDPTSRNSWEATWRLNAAMRRAGFPPRFFHSTGFRGLIDDQRYRQQPRGLLVGYSDDFFLVPNNHGRIFGPDPVETSSGYVWSGAFSREEFAFVNGLPRHVYVSSNEARDALAADLVASGRASLGSSVWLDNAYNTDTTTTGDHDGYAAVLVLHNPYAVGTSTLAAGEATSNRTCVAAGTSANSTANMACALVTVATVSAPQ